MGGIDHERASRRCGLELDVNAFHVLDEVLHGCAHGAVGRVAELVQGDFEQLCGAIGAFRAMKFVHCRRDEDQRFEQLTNGFALVRTMSAGRGRLLSMSEIVALEPSPELEAVYRDLRAVSARIIRRNNQNRDLLQSSMSFVRRTLSFITGNFRYKLLDQKV